jgi:hypothetical protein
MAKPSDLLTQFTAGMQNLDSSTKFSGRLVFALLGKLRHFSQSNCRQEQEKKPCQAADVPGGSRPENPGDCCDRQHHERCEPPAMIWRAWPPRPDQHQQRRHDRKENEDVIEIH